MVADDQEELLRSLTWWLGRKFEVIGAVNDGRKLVNGAISLKPDVIISDVVMPHVSGTQALEELNSRGCYIPFVFLTCEPDLVGAGMGSIVDKLDLHKELEEAVRTAASGKIYFSRSVCRNQGFERGQKGYLPSPQNGSSGRE